MRSRVLRRAVAGGLRLVSMSTAKVAMDEAHGLRHDEDHERERR
jgi:hypothetical protein